MTMDNGEGRPLDEIEAGNEDPQGWYFDLPGGAWERQEEKNRTLRQRVLGNLSEDEARAKSEPFGRKPADPEEKKSGRGLFGRRKKDDGNANERTSPGGTWVLNRPGQPSGGDETRSEPPRTAFEDDDADDWSTEPSLKLTPFPRTQSRAEDTWGEPDAGWDLSAPGEPQESEPAGEPLFQEFGPAAGLDVEASPTPGEWPTADSGTEDFLASMRSWAQEQQDEGTPEDVPQFRVPTYEEALAEDPGEADEPEQPTLTLRPRQRETDEKQLDWNFGPAAWGSEDDRPTAFVNPVEPAAHDEPAEETFVASPSWDDASTPAMEQEDAAEFSTPAMDATPDDATADEDPMESMRRWAERNRGADHPHFTVSHHEEDADEASSSAPIPLRPRSQDEPAASRFAPVTPADAEDGAPRPPLQLPIVRRPRDEEPEPVHSEKWNDFFAISSRDEAESDDSTEDDAGPSEGLAAMRAWAQKRHEPETPENIPEEFLKPFDWELEESTATDVSEATEVPAEFLKPFDWESDDNAQFAAGDASEDIQAAPPAVTPLETVEREAPLMAADHLAEPAQDPLDGIFPAAMTELPREEKKKPGRFGRLFGRGKKDDQPAPAAPEAEALGDWLLPDDEADVRVAAKADDWSEDAGTLEAPQSLKATGEGWGASLSEGWARSDNEAINEFSDSIHDKGSEWLPEPAAASLETAADDPAATVEAEDQPEPVAEPAFQANDDEDEDGWNPEPLPASFEWTQPASDTAPEQSASDEATVQGGFTWEPDEVEPVAPVEAVASVEPVEEPVTAETPWWERSTDDQPASEPPVEAVASIESVEEPASAEAWWKQPGDVEPAAESPVEAVASVEPTEEPAAAETAWWERPADSELAHEAQVEAVASIEPVEEPAAPEAWWEQPGDVEPAAESPVEAVASVQPTEEPAAAETAWWERTADSEPAHEAQVEAVASIEPVEEPAAPEAWWEQPTDDEPASEAPVEAVASVEPTEEPAAAETAWWEQPVDSEPAHEAQVEAVASIEPVEEPAATETPWWEQPADVEPAPEAAFEAVASVQPAEEAAAAETPWWGQPADAEPVQESPVEAVASVEEPPAAETPWWEQPTDDQPAPEAQVEAIASVQPIEEPTATETPWWEQPADVRPAPEEPVEAVASVQPAEEPAAAQTAWWEQPADSEPAAESPAEAVASVQPAEEPAAAQTAWWEQPADVGPASEAPVEAVASVEPAEEPAAAESAWWERPADVEPAEEAPVEAVASNENHDSVDQHPDIAASVAEPQIDDDDPWADFVKSPASSSEPEPLTMPLPRWRSEPVRPPSDEDMWGHIAAQAEEHAAAEQQLDLAASLESQMAEERVPPAYHWDEPDETEWSEASSEPHFPSDHEEDVILAAFERHAATPEVPVARENDEVFAELLGDQAAEIVAEASDDEAGRESFLKMSAWAPQRRAEFDGGWAPEQEVEEAIAGGRPAFGGIDGAGFAPPSWAVDEFEGGPEAAPAAAGHHRTKTWIRELVETGLLALLVFLSVRASFQNFKVEGSSMYPTLENGQFLIVNKLVYSEVDMDKLSNFVPFVDAGSDPKRNVFHGPERGDIIVLKDPRNTETDLIKRVIGLPGETIEIVDGKVYINDHLLDEPYIKAVWHDTKPKVLIPPGEYFVMGDNRDNSLDSRSSQVGLVPQDLIIGKAMLSYWPRDKFGLAPNEEGKLGDEKPVLTTQRIGD